VLDLMAAIRGSDCVIIVTNHKSYDYKAIFDAANFIFDSRNGLGKMDKDHPKVVKL
jgi:UDP-N-acetyl-D-glucosamine dehydrogenase